MKKIYNNLSIENLMKTEKFNQFDEIQQKQIELGLKNNLDISIYAKPELDFQQMNEIRLGLIDNLDVSKYAKSEYTWEQMEKIRLELKAKSEIKNEKNI